MAWHVVNFAAIRWLGMKLQQNDFLANLNCERQNFSDMGFFLAYVRVLRAWLYGVFQGSILLGISSIMIQT